ncbi:hypothetical protein N7495_000436 [Penicillium taxi]|uniref:uncharacterized protein n=1 Tax=Penicillium taxi TaxID=168475 RepID=UPI002545B3ED|nr:uncharacterized protein N7495_000436 [Penicillium taxi]KAJ5907754.1 hypothetical protein N7495_000436 [Penicillium taxi]
MFTNGIPEGNRRKRVRKGTKSCSECSSICSGCQERNTPCLSQEYADDHHSPSAEDLRMAHRMARVESLLETLMDKPPPQNSVDGLTRSSIPAAMGRSQPLFASLTDGIPVQADVSPAIGKFESLRRQLTAMLFCQEDVDYLFASSYGWWLIQQHMMPYATSSDEIDPRGIFSVGTVLTENLMAVTRLLLCIAICIQQLSSDVDIYKIQTAVPLRQTMSSIVGFIAQNVASDDEMTGSLEGVECLALQGIYEVVAFRKAITVAQLLGLHRATVKTSQKIFQENIDLEQARRSDLWYQISRAERYLSVMLGVPSSIGAAAFNSHYNAPWLSTEHLYHKNLYQISGLILARNQGDFTHSFSTTQRIGEQLDSFAKQMSPDWWEIPASLLSTRTNKASVEFERIMCQIWPF